MKLVNKKSKFDKLFKKHILRKRIVPRQFLEEYPYDKNEYIQKPNPSSGLAENLGFIQLKSRDIFETPSQ